MLVRPVVLLGVIPDVLADEAGAGGKSPGSGCLLVARGK